MPRLPRFFVPETPLHVIQRGNNREPIFDEATDLDTYIGCLGCAARKHEVAIHAYVLMTNHVHLLATPDRADALPRVMQSVGVAYAKYFNAKYSRTGTLFEGRYRAALVDSEHYLLACMRYIELNPVRAQMVRVPVDYAWSSHRTNAHGAKDTLVTAHPMYRNLGTSGADRQAAYRSLFSDSLTSEVTVAIRDATQFGWALGTSAFRATVAPFGRRPDRSSMGRPRKQVRGTS